MAFSIMGLILGFVFAIFGVLFIHTVYKSYKRGFIYYHFRPRFVFRRKEQPILFWFWASLIFLLGVWLLVLALLFVI